jgi:hypothetical protein
MTANAALISAVHAMARSKACTPSQISLAWLLAQGSDIIPLVGTKTVARLQENAAAVSVCLTEEEVLQLSALPPLKVIARCLFSATPDAIVIYEFAFGSALVALCHLISFRLNDMPFNFFSPK